MSSSTDNLLGAFKSLGEVHWLTGQVSYPLKDSVCMDSLTFLAIAQLLEKTPT